MSPIFLRHKGISHMVNNKSDNKAEWAKKKLVWVPHEPTGYVAASMKRQQGEEVEVEIVETGKRKMVAKAGVTL